jgi:ketosteroid isomerase-like protein
MRTLLLISALALCSTAQADVPAQAAAEIDKINADWGIAMQKGDVDTEVAPYAQDAVFCGQTGKCFSGLAAITDMMRAAMTKSGPLRSAKAQTTKRVEDHGYIYEWGRATMVTGAGKTVAGGYFTIWAKQPDGHWKIFRNIVLPRD